MCNAEKRIATKEIINSQLPNLFLFVFSIRAKDNSTMQRNVKYSFRLLVVFNHSKNLDYLETAVEI